jgi:dihydrodipicolinate synthase/N-acetylneuraminate lyase
VNELPSGIIPILATAFDSAGRIDERSFVRQVEMCVSDGVSAVAMFGLASEYYKLSDCERDRLARVTVDAAGGRVPVILSITPHARELAVAEARRFAAAGADALMVIPPSFLAPPEEAILSHVGAVANAVSLPVIVQYAPAHTGRTIEPSAFARLAEIYPNVAAVKIDMAPSAPFVAALRQASGERLALYVGYMGLDLPDAFDAGAAGCMPTASLARMYVEFWRLLGTDRRRGGLSHTTAFPAIQFLMQSVEFLIACEKRLLVRRGIFDTAYSRAPFATLADLDIAQLEEFIHAEVPA